MTRRKLEDFSDKNISRIFIARNLAEAEKVENLLNENKIDFAVEIEAFLQSSWLQSQLQGAAFYVVSGQSHFCRQLIAEEGLKSGIVYD